MIALAAAISADAFVVVRKATASISAAITLAIVWLVVALSAWIGVMLILRARRRRERSPTRQARSLAAA